MLLYIKKFVQTLNDIDAKYLHDTHKYERQIKEQGIELGKDYLNKSSITVKAEHT